MPNFTYKEFVDSLTPEGIIVHLNRAHFEGRLSPKYYETALDKFIKVGTWFDKPAIRYIAPLVFSLWKLDNTGFEILPGTHNISIGADSLMTYLRTIDFNSMNIVPTAKMLTIEANKTGDIIPMVKDEITTLMVMTSALYALKMGKTVEIENQLMNLSYPITKSSTRRKHYAVAKNLLEDNIRMSHGTHLSSVLSFLTDKTPTPDIAVKNWAY